MPPWVRAVFAVLAGFVTWFVVATVGNFAIRGVVPGYTDAEPTMQFSLGMLLARLALGAVSSVVSGVACAYIARGVGRPVYVYAVLLLALFVPVHVGLWHAFPVWYHLLFLGSLLPLVVLGARLLPVSR
jgi:hypothetical protein